MAIDFAGGYASPTLRKGVFDLLHPGALCDFEIIPIEEAFPDGHTDTGGEECEDAVVCTLICDDGTYYQAAKEIALFEQRKGSNAWQPRVQSPENYQKDCTQAMGRALTVAGMPMHVGALRMLLDVVRPPAAVVQRAAGGRINTATGEVEGAEPTLDRRAAMAFTELDAPLKARVAEWAKREGILNVMRAGERANDLLAKIAELRGETA